MMDTIEPEVAPQETLEEQLTRYITEAEVLAERAQIIKEDRSALFAAAKADGIDVKALKVILKQRKMDREKLEEEETTLRTYQKAMGILPDHVGPLPTYLEPANA